MNMTHIVADNYSGPVHKQKIECQHLISSFENKKNSSIETNVVGAFEESKDFKKPTDCFSIPNDIMRLLYVVVLTNRSTEMKEQTGAKGTQQNS